MHKRQPPKTLGVLDRKPPSNPKYKDVVGKLNTGLTIDKVKSITAREFTRRRDEIHFRLTKKQLFQLYNEYENDDEEQFRHLSLNDDEDDEDDRHRRSPTRIVTHSETAKPEYERPYLILDVREPENYARCHLLQSRSYPYTMCRRDFLHPEIPRFKNLENHLVIIYCDDERISRDVAKTLVDRGTDNIFLLTGGLNEFAMEYPTWVEGDVPNFPTQPKKPKAFAFLAPIGEDRKFAGGDDYGGLDSPLSQRSPMTARSSGASRRSARDTSSASRLTASRLTSQGRLTGRRGEDDARSESGASTRSNFSVAESVFSRATSRKGMY